MRTVGYSRCSKYRPADADEQRRALVKLGAEPEQIYLDAGFVGMARPRPALDLALAACREGDTLVVTGLERLARSVEDAADLLSRLASREVTVSLGGHAYEPTATAGLSLGSLVTMVAEFEAALARGRVVEGMYLARTKGRLKGRGTKLKPMQQKFVLDRFNSGEDSVAEIAEILGIGRATVYRTVARARRAQAEGHQR